MRAWAVLAMVSRQKVVRRSARCQVVVGVTSIQRFIKGQRAYPHEGLLMGNGWFRPMPFKTPKIGIEHCLLGPPLAPYEIAILRRSERSFFLPT